jgi:hypothetical protein
VLKLPAGNDASMWHISTVLLPEGVLLEDAMDSLERPKAEWIDASGIDGPIVVQPCVCDASSSSAYSLQLVSAYSFGTTVTTTMCVSCHGHVGNALLNPAGAVIHS